MRGLNAVWWFVRGRAAQQYYVRGDGLVWSKSATVNGLLTAGSGSFTTATIGSGGLTVEGGTTVTDGGLYVADGSTITTDANENVLEVTQSLSSGYTSTLLTVQAAQVRVECRVPWRTVY